MEPYFTLRTFLPLSSLLCLCFLAGCGGDSGASATVASNNSSPVAAASQGVDQAQSGSRSGRRDEEEEEDTSLPVAEKPQSSYGGEETSQSQGGGFSGRDSGADDDRSGGFGFDTAFSGGGQTTAPSSGPPTGGPPRAGRGMRSGGPGAGAPAASGQGIGGRGNDDSGRDDDAFGVGGLGSGRGGFGFGTTEGSESDVAGMTTGFLRQYCVSCHGANDPKGDVRLDTLTEDIARDTDEWKSVADVVDDGSMPPNRARQPEAGIRSQFVSFIKEKLGSSVEATFLQQAESAYKKGDQTEATKLFYLHALTVDDGQAADVLDNLKLYRPKVSKPEDLIASTDYALTVKPHLKTQLTLAVGVILKADENVTDVKPVGVPQSGGAGGIGGGELGGFGRGLGSGGASQSSEENRLTAFEDLTGDYGKALVEAFKTRREEEKYGSLFATVNVDRPKAEAGAGNIAGPGLGFGGRDDEGLSGSFGAGRRGGEDDQGLAGGFAVGGGPVGNGNNANSNPSKTMPDQQLANGLVYVGKGKINELFEKATDIGADGIFLFDINSSKNNRSNLVTTDTRLRFMLISGKVIATASKFLNNREIERLSAQNKESNDIQKQVDQIFTRIDSVLSLESVPEMPESSALKHIHGLIHSDADPLQIMTQARLFQSKGIISSDQLAMIYQIVLEGNEGISLASGSEADKKLVLESVLSRL